MDKNYNVDDILAEIKSRKSKQRTPSAPRHEQQTKLPAEPAPGFGQAEEAAPSMPPTAEEGTTMSFTPIRPESVKPPAEKREKAPPSSLADSDGFSFVMPPVERVPRNPLDFDGHVRPITDKAKIRRDRALRKEAAEPAVPATGAGQTQDFAPVIDFTAFKPPAGALDETDSPAVPSAEPALPVEPPAEHQRTRILDIGRSRELQLEDIQRMDFGAVAGDPDGYEVDDYPDGAAPVPGDLSEYNSVSDRGAVARDIAHVKLWLVLRCLFTAVLTAALFYMTLAGRETSLPLLDFFLPERDMRMYLAGITGLSVLVALVGSSTVGGGLISLFKMRANSDSLAALAILAAIGQSVAGIVKPSSINPAELSLYASVAALSMLFNALGKTTMINRIQANFRIISSEKQKRAVLPVQSPEFMREFTRDPESRRPTIAYSAKAGFFTDFLALSYSDKYDVGVNRGVAPVCLGGAVLVCIITYVFTRNSAAAIGALTAILCVSATFSSTFIENIPLGKLTKRLAPRGGMVSGNKTVETFCDTKAIILRENDLFPMGHVQLRGIKAYAHGRIDEAILDAASVICSIDSALSPVFLQMIGGNRKLLKKVDNIVYENDMGISAWVNRRRVLIGNRRLMENHGIALPAGGYEQKYAEYGGEALYLSSSGELSAQFVVSYHIDEELAVSLDQMAARGKQLIIFTMDPNITTHKLWELYGYPEDLIDILPAEMHESYTAMSAPMATATAEIAYTGRASVMVEALLACIHARSSILAATIIQLVQIALGYGIIILAAPMAAMSTLNILQLSAYQLFWFAAIFIVQQVRSA